MSRRIRYFLWNKTADFGTGWGRNVRYTDEGLYLEKHGEGIYFSRLLDSGEHGKRWSRAAMTGMFPEGTLTEITFYASDQAEFLHNGVRYALADVLLDPKLKPEDKFLLTQNSNRCTYRNCCDMLMQGVEGQYLWYVVRLRSSAEKPSISQLKIWLDDFSWLSYLPEIYREDAQGADFTARFLGIFQNLYEEMHEQINSIPSFYDLDSADREFLDWISGWAGIENGELWSDEQLRTLLKRGRELYRKAGTVDMIASMAELYTGIRPVILENYYAADAASANKAWQTHQFRREPFSFTVILPKTAVNSESEHRALLSILQQCKPAHMRMQLIFMDGKESAGELPQSICLDGRTALMQGGNT